MGLSLLLVVVALVLVSQKEEEGPREMGGDEEEEAFVREGHKEGMREEERIAATATASLTQPKQQAPNQSKKHPAQKRTPCVAEKQPN